MRRDLLVDRCTVTRAGTLTGDVDPDTGLETEGPDTTVASNVPCFLRLISQVMNTDRTAAGDVVAIQQPTLSVDVSVTLQYGDIAVITSSQDVANVGRRLRVTSLPTGTFTVRHAYQVEEVTG